jgi:hypothetical protein
MTDFFTSCLQSEKEAVKTYLTTQENPKHIIVEELGPFDEVWLQRNDGYPKLCCSQPGDGKKMLIHSRT